MRFKEFMGVKVMPKSRTWELLENRDTKTARRVVDYTNKAAECFYDVVKLAELRTQYADVV